MIVRLSLVLAVLTAAGLAAPHSAVAQHRGVAIARSRVVVRPVIVGRARPTVFIGGYYHPWLYRAPLYYGAYGDPYFRRPWHYQWPYGLGGYDLSGSVRFQVSPKQAEVFVDGYYAGTVDDFDGVFQRLSVEPGDHELELYLAGHRVYQQRVYLQPGRTFTVRHTMEPLAPGDPEPPRPAGAPVTASARPDPRAPGGRPSRPAPTPGQNLPAEFGELSLRVQPADAEVIIDGETWAGTLDDERLVVQLGTGVHRLEIRKDGYRSYFTDVTLRGGETRRLNVALTKQ